MKRLRPAFALLALLAIVVVGPSALQAQKSTSKTSPVSSLPDLSQLNIASTLSQMQSASMSGNGDAPSPLQIVVQFLQLTPGQQDQFATLLQARQAAIVPLIQQIHQLTQQLQSLLASGGNPAQIGITVIQINAIQQQVAQHQQAFLSAFVGMLASDQQQRFELIQIAAQLQPIVPAFQQLCLF